MTPEQLKMAEAMMDMQVSNIDHRWLELILLNDSELDEEDDYRLKMLYDGEFGYGIEE